ncbi:hypothetical protein HDU76_010014, partial [Blyttiomyces sp. JEL0837]
MPPSTSQSSNDIAHPGTYGGKNYSDYSVYEKKALTFMAGKKLRHIIDTEVGKEPKKPDGDEPDFILHDPYPVREPRVAADDPIDPTRAATQGNRHTADTARIQNENADRDYKDAVDKFNADSKRVEAIHRNWVARNTKYEKWRNESDEAIGIFENLFPKEIGDSIRRSQAYKISSQTFHDFIAGYRKYYNSGVKTGTESTYWKTTIQDIINKYSGSNRPSDPTIIEWIIDQFDEAGYKAFEVMPRDVFNDQQIHKTILIEFCNGWGYIQPRPYDFNDFNKKNRDDGMNGWDTYFEWIDEVRVIIAAMKHFNLKHNPTLGNNNHNNGNNSNQRKPGDPYPDNKRKGASADTKGKNKKTKIDTDKNKAGSTGPCEYHNIPGHPTNKCNHLKRLRESKEKDDRNEYSQIMKDIRQKRNQANKAKPNKDPQQQASKVDSTSDKNQYDLRQDLSRAVEKFAKKCVICQESGHTDLADCPTLGLAFARKALKQVSGSGNGSGSKVNDTIAPRSHYAFDKLTATHLRDDMNLVTKSQALRGKTTHPLWKSLLGNASLFHVSRDSKMLKANSFNKSLADSGSSSCMSENIDIFDTFEE